MPVYAYSFYVLVDILITFYINSISSCDSNDNDNNNNSPKNDSISPNIINTIQCISILIFNPIVAYKLNFKKIFNVLYTNYKSNANEENESQYYSQNQSKGQLKKANRNSNQKFEISSINFF